MKPLYTMKYVWIAVIIAEQKDFEDITYERDI